jgi:hypothetical protein
LIPRNVILSRDRSVSIFDVVFRIFTSIQSRSVAAVALTFFVCDESSQRYDQGVFNGCNIAAIVKINEAPHGHYALGGIGKDNVRCIASVARGGIMDPSFQNCE